jgi:LmbE family N-acetylglucosaminyl deacetylase
VTVRLAGVFAHPDDDSYVLGGTLLLHPGRLAPSLVFATSGEAGPIAAGTATRDGLGAAREGEQRAFLEAVGYADAPTRFLRHPDYHLPQAPFERLVGEVEAVLGQARPQLVVSFGPDGLTSHHDHIRAGEAAAEAFRRARAAEGNPDDAFLRLYQAAYPRSDVDRFYAGVREGGFGYDEEGRLFDLTGVPDERIAVRVDTRAVAARKWAAILRHRTQLDEHRRIPEPLRWIVLGRSASCRRSRPGRPWGRSPAACWRGWGRRWPPGPWSGAAWTATWWPTPRCRPPTPPGCCWRPPPTGTPGRRGRSRPRRRPPWRSPRPPTGWSSAPRP